jgi:adenosylhomocysteine nucleosidase
MSMPASGKVDLGIVVALREEEAAVVAALSVLPAERAQRVRVVRGGMGGAAAHGAAQKLLGIAPGLKLLASSGFCGGLDASLAPGSVFLATAVTARAETEKKPAHTETLTADPAALQTSASALRAAGLEFHQGLLVTVARPVLTPPEKTELARASGAAAVDMEAAAIARVARARGAAFLSLRTATDGAQDDLPPEVAEFLDEDGKVRTGKVLRYVAGGTKRLHKLWELKSRSDKAVASLTAAWQAALPELLAWLDR